jgi:hypothetical protein
MQFLLSAKELTELAKEVAAVADRLHMRATPGNPPPKSLLQKEAVKRVLQERGIQYEPGDQS